MNPFARDAQSQQDPHNIQHLLSLLRPDELPMPEAEPAKPSDPRLKGRQPHRPSPNASPAPSAAAAAAAAAAAPPPPTAKARIDVRYLTPSQGLPELRRLAKDATFLRQVMRLKREQDALERRLADERKDRQEKRQKMGGTGGEEEERWARDALSQWDALVSSQQEVLHKAGLPGFYQTSSPAARDNQRKILELLGELIEADD